MATPLTRQDIVAITDNAKNRIVERIVPRSDIQNVTDNARDRILSTVSNFHIENQTLIRQSSSQTDQINRRIAALESQISSTRQEIKNLTQAVNRLYDLQAQRLGL